jgi:hypothetical protein
MRLPFGALLACLLSAFSLPAMAGILYNNVTSNSFNTDLYLINGDGYYDGNVTSYALADAFTLSSADTVTGATVGLETLVGDSPQSLGFVISSAPFGGTVYASGSQSLTPTSEGSHYFPGAPTTEFALWDATLSFTPLSLGPGTYYFQLESGVTADSGSMWWDASQGPAGPTYYLYGGGGQTLGGPIAYSETFTILGSSNTSATPEAPSLMLLATGLFGGAALLHRKSKSQTRGHATPPLAPSLAQGRNQLQPLHSAPSLA